MKEWNYNKTLKKIDLYVLDTYSKDPTQAAKVFYDLNEWSGWRFYLKAIRHKDWHSIKYHILSHFRGTMYERFQTSHSIDANGYCNKGCC